MANLILNRPKIHVILPDSHSTPEHDNSRYDLVGQLLIDIKPDVFIDIGDFFDMSSLCLYDKGLRSYEGRRYKKDIEAGLDAQERIVSPIRRAKKKKPRFVRTLGNHEARITRAIEKDPILEGTIGLSDLQSKDYGFEEHGFLSPVEIDGVVYSHYFTSGVMGRPTASSRVLLQKQFKSCSHGHGHTFDYHTASNALGERIHGLSVGCFIDHHHNYAGPANKLWDSGVVIKRNVEDGNYDLEWISMARLKKEYGK